MRFHPATTEKGKEICVFCHSSSKLTREHVLPRWLFEKDTSSSFVSSVNRQIQTYNKAVIPVCAYCNNSVLAPIEKFTIDTIHRLAAAETRYIDDLCHIMRWLEIMDYKGQVYDCRRKYIKYGRGDYDEDWGIFTVAMMRHFIDMDPLKAQDYLRSTQRRITVKEKIDRLNSFVVFKTREPHFNFFVQPNEYIFVSAPMFNVAFFYFFRRKFRDPLEASETALLIMHKVFNS